MPSLTNGSRLGPYEVIGPLGSGGMGEVYRARDPRLDREVAIKVLPDDYAADADRLARFEREAKATAALNHPNLLAIHDIGVHEGAPYMVCELLEGETLRDRLDRGPTDLPTALRVARHVASGLATTHDKGIVHRDLKPDNIFLLADGRAKILDFGLATFAAEVQLQDAGLAEGVTVEQLTREGVVLGTVGYMAPEQVDGRPTDGRSDLFALGVILYEMIAGRPPFQRETIIETLHAILKEAPVDLTLSSADLPEGLARLVSHLMEKRASDRFQSAGDLLYDLEGVEARSGSRHAAMAVAAESGDPGDAVGGRIRALAVLPLVNLSRDPAQEYFADGMTEALISDLSQIKALRVISRTSVMQYQGARKPLPEIARELGVEAIIEGSALLVGNQVRITAQLVDARQDRSLWSQRYERDLENVLSLQTEVARAVAKEIRVQLTPREVDRLEERPAVNAEAHVAYLKGRHQWNRGSPEGIEASIRLYEEALRVDPAYALAWAGLAGSQMTRAYRGMAPALEAGEASRQAALKALELDPFLGEAHATLAQIQFRIDWDWNAAARRFKVALDLSPGDGRIHLEYGHILSSLERHEEAISLGRRAIQLDPLSMIMRTGFGDVLYFAREYEQSILSYKEAIDLDPHFDGAHTDLARSYEELGRFDEAMAEYEEGARLTNRIAHASIGMAHLYARSGRESEARRMRDEFARERASRAVPAWGLATLSAVLGDTDETFRWLEAAVEARESALVFLRIHPRLDSIRSDRRYQRLLKRLGHGMGDVDSIS